MENRDSELACISEESSSINDGAEAPSPRLLRPLDDFTDDGKDFARTLVESDRKGPSTVT